MRLADIFNNENQITQTDRLQTDSGRGEYIMKQIMSLVPGQTLRGELLTRTGNEIQIRVMEDFILGAKLDQNMNLEVGKNILFEVKNNGRTLTLSPLQTNVATDANIIKALDMASLPVNEKSVNMTSKLMEAGLPINKDALQNVYKEVNIYQDAEISDIVTLHRMGLEVNDSNVNQMNSYRNLSYKLIEGFNNVADSLVDLFDSVISKGDFDASMKLSQMVEILLKDNNLFSEAPNVEIPPMHEQGNVPLNATADMNAALDKVVSEMADEMVDEMPTETMIKSSSEVVSRDLNSTIYNDAGNIAEILDKNIATDEDLVLLLKNSINDVFQNRGTEIFFSNETLSSIKDLFSTLLDRIKESWTIEPEKLKDEKTVTNLYKKLTTQLKTIAEIIESADKTDSMAYKNVTNMSRNIDFLEQINQAYTYIQLPLKFQDNDAHGDLYVYTNKKNLAKRDGQISALLHLDMKNLGPVDVYVTMQNENVNTHFYVADDDMLDFLNSNMDKLTIRLKKKGYSCQVSFEVKEYDKLNSGGVNKLLEQEKPIVFSEYAFDVRT